jgi:ATP sulfurylase
MADETDGGGGGIQAVKAARNQALWREVNERIRVVAQTSGEMEFLCECANLECTETINLSVAEYEHIRSSPVRFPIMRGHDFPEVENVVQENDRYVVVEKIGKAAEEAAKLDPRSTA